MNRFGSSGLMFPLVDPRVVHAARERFRRDRVPFLDRANGLYVPAGRLPVRGWLLLPRYEYDQLNPYSTDLRLEIGDPRKPNNVGTLRGLSIVQAQCVTTGLAGVSEPNAIYLVELTDARGILSNRWFSCPLTVQYNVRAPAYPQTDRGGTYYTSTMNGGTSWTWETMLRDMWERMDGADGNNLLGPWPGLPAGTTLGGTPEGYIFSGVPAWPALCEVLEHLGLDVACDLTADAPYTIVESGAADAAFDALASRYGDTNSPHSRIEDDLEWIDVGAGRVPKTVMVLFRRRNAAYGTEETVRRDPLQWGTSAIHTVSVTAPALFASAAGVHHLWSDFTVRYDVDGVVLDADRVYAEQIAAERVVQYFREVYDTTLGYMSRTYAGALPFTTGSRVDGVCWCQDLRGDDRTAWRTRIVRGPDPPWPGVWGEQQS